MKKVERQRQQKEECGEEMGTKNQLIAELIIFSLLRILRNNVLSSLENKKVFFVVFNLISNLCKASTYLQSVERVSKIAMFNCLFLFLTSCNEIAQLRRGIRVGKRRKKN